MNKLLKSKTLLLGGLILVLALCIMSVLFVKIGTSTYAKASAESDSELIFDPINDGTEYSVRVANRKTITQAYIPYIHNGKEVTEISNNGFAGCTNLLKVYIPKTITRIGNNAFVGCSNLETVYTFEKNENESFEIGSNAFYNCPNINNMIIPKSTTKISSGAFKNVRGTLHVLISESEANSKYDANWVDETVTPVVYNSDYSRQQIEYTLNDTGTAYFVEKQAFSNNENDEIVIEQTHDGLPVDYIVEFAFQFNVIGKLTIEESTNSHKIKIYPNAFFFSEIKEINCGNSVKFDTTEEGGSEFALSGYLKEVTLPKNITKINNNMFDDCGSLETIHFSGTDIKNTVPSTVSNFVIGDSAFKSCVNLGTLAEDGIKEFVIPKNVSKIEANAFTSWTDKQRLNIKFKEDERPTGWSIDWCGEKPDIKLLWEKYEIRFCDGYGKTFKTEYGYTGDKITIPVAPKMVCFYSKWQDNLINGDEYEIKGDATISVIKTGEKPINECYDNETQQYKIETYNQLSSLRNFDTHGKTFNVNVNLDDKLWTPIPYFYGTITGSITHFKIQANAKSGYFGLFGINYGTINSLDLLGTIEIYGEKSSDCIYAGLICGKNEGTISECMINSNLDYYILKPLYPDTPTTYIKYSIICERANSYVGGITGFNAGTIIECNNYATIYSCGNLGGIAGGATGPIKDCYSSADMRYYYDYFYIFNDSIGGIVGVTESKVENCFVYYGYVSYHRREAITDGYLTPCMGTIVGQLKGSNAEIIDCSIDHAGVTTGGLLDDQKIYAEGGPVGCYNYDNILI